MDNTPQVEMVMTQDCSDSTHQRFIARPYSVDHFPNTEHPVHCGGKVDIWINPNIGADWRRLSKPAH